MPVSPEAMLEQVSRHLDAAEIPQALQALESAVVSLRDLVQAARVDGGGEGSYAPSEHNRFSALRTRTADLLVRLEAARREVEDELTAIRSQRAFEREAASEATWFESRV